LRSGAFACLVGPHSAKTILALRVYDVPDARAPQREIDLANNAKNLSAAEIQFKKTQHTVEGKKTVIGYEADAIAANKKTERLKALRLARDAAEAAANPAAPPKKKRASKPKKENPQAGTLTGWRKAQSEDGRNT